MTHAADKCDLRRAQPLKWDTAVNCECGIQAKWLEKSGICHQRDVPFLFKEPIGFSYITAKNYDLRLSRQLQRVLGCGKFKFLEII